MVPIELSFTFKKKRRKKYIENSRGTLRFVESWVMESGSCGMIGKRGLGE